MGLLCCDGFLPTARVLSAADDAVPSLSQWVCITDKEQDKAHVRALEGVLQLLGATDTEIVLKVRHSEWPVSTVQSCMCSWVGTAHTSFRILHDL
jgi:hypothetical protein